MTKAASGGSVWAYGIKEPGWYVAATEWSESYAEHLRSLGYTVERSISKPTTVPSPTTAQVTISEVYGDMDIN